MSYIVGLSTEMNALAVVSPAAGSLTQALDAEGSCCWPALAVTLIASATIAMNPTIAAFGTLRMRDSRKNPRAFYADGDGTPIVWGRRGRRERADREVRP
jgi:hypothetical protein